MATLRGWYFSRRDDLPTILTCPMATIPGSCEKVVDVVNIQRRVEHSPVKLLLDGGLYCIQARLESVLMFGSEPPRAYCNRLSYGLRCQSCGQPVKPFTGTYTIVHQSFHQWCGKSNVRVLSWVGPDMWMTLSEPNNVTTCHLPVGQYPVCISTAFSFSYYLPVAPGLHDTTMQAAWILYQMIWPGISASCFWFKVVHWLNESTGKLDYSMSSTKHVITTPNTCTHFSQTAKQDWSRLRYKTNGLTLTLRESIRFDYGSNTWNQFWFRR